jgi:hypothetical protein
MKSSPVLTASVSCGWPPDCSTLMTMANFGSEVPPSPSNVAFSATVIVCSPPARRTVSSLASSLPLLILSSSATALS